MKLIMFTFHFIQSIIAICLLHWTEKIYSMLGSLLWKMENIAERCILSTPCFFSHNSITVEVHPGYNELCCSENRTGKFAAAKE